MYETLGNITETVMGQAPPSSKCNKIGDGVPFVKVGEFGEQRPEIREWTTKPLKLATKSDVLLCVVGATCGKINLGEDCAIGRSVAAIRPLTNKIDQMYLYHFLKSWTDKLRAMSQGAAQTVITKNMIAGLQIPLPPLEEQRRIAAILDKADALRRKREKAIVLTDDLLRSTFLDMFGDPMRKSVSSITISEVAEVIMGQSPPGDTYNKNKEGVPLINGPVEYGHRYPIERQWTTAPKKLSKEGDILFCVRGATAGKLNWSDKEYCIGRGVASIRPKNPKISNFLFFNLLIAYDYFQNLGVGSTFINISRDNLLQFQIPKASESEMIKFSNFASKTIETKDTYRGFQSISDDFFSSLTQRAFRGELTSQKEVA